MYRLFALISDFQINKLKRMKLKAQSLIIFLLLGIVSCSKDNEKSVTFSDAYDELVMRFTSLDSLSAFTHVSKNDLINIRYGAIPEDQELTETMALILDAYQNKKSDELKSIKSKSKEYALGGAERSIAIEEFSKINKNRIQKYPEIKENIIFDCMDDNIDDFIGRKYSLLAAIPNTWNYYTKSEQEFAEDFLNDFNASDIGKECDEYYNKRINDYKNAVCDEYSFITHGSLAIPDFSVMASDADCESDDTLKELVIDRVKSQIAEISSDIFWDIIVALIVAFIFSLIIDNAIDGAKQRAIDTFIKRLSWKKGDGFLKNLGRTLLNGIGVYGEYEAQVDSIRRKYNSIKVIVDICVFILSLLIAWKFFIMPQLKMESEINKELSMKLIDSSNTLSINPERMINQFVGIDESEIVTDVDSDPEEAAEEVSDNFVGNKATGMGDYPIVMDGETVFTYSGNIGEYPILMEYVKSYETEDGEITVEGRYKYVEAGNILSFKGTQYPDDTIDLKEYTPSGKNSGEFHLRHQNNSMTGVFVNLVNGNKLEVTLNLN